MQVFLLFIFIFLLGSGWVVSLILIWFFFDFILFLLYILLSLLYFKNKKGINQNLKNNNILYKF